MRDEEEDHLLTILAITDFEYESFYTIFKILLMRLFITLHHHAFCLSLQNHNDVLGPKSIGIKFYYFFMDTIQSIYEGRKKGKGTLQSIE